MASYISSNDNRFYVGIEESYGKIAAISAANRVPGMKLAISQQVERPARRDKTGSRTFAGSPAGRRRTSFELRTYLSSWQKSADAPAPGYAPLFQAALGGEPTHFAGGTVASSTAAGRVTFENPHGISAGQAVAFGGEIRFVTAIPDQSTVQLNAPFTNAPAEGAAIGSCVTYGPATKLPSLSIFDYWSPQTALQRVLHGAAVDELAILVNGDFHELRFRGLAKDVVDTATYAGDDSVGLSTQFPEEPAISSFEYSLVPGQIGQAWLGVPAGQFYTVTEASVVLRNALETRSNEFGSSLPRAIWPGERTVHAAFELYSQDDEATRALYQAARQQSPIEVMFQLGDAEGQLMGVYVKSVVPELPDFDDSDNRLRWSFRASRAQGTVDDEIAIAFA